MPRRNLYFGRAGQLAVMGEILERGWNVAIPEVDVGDDIFAVRDSNGEFFRVQVKSATGIARGYGFSAQFNIPLDQLRRPITPELIYIFPVRFEGIWHSYIVISREALNEFNEIRNFGTIQGDSLIIRFSYAGENIYSGTVANRIDFTEYRNNFNDFPRIDHN